MKLKNLTKVLNLLIFRVYSKKNARSKNYFLEKIKSVIFKYKILEKHYYLLANGFEICIMIYKFLSFKILRSHSYQLKSFSKCLKNFRLKKEVIKKPQKIKIRLPITCSKEDQLYIEKSHPHPFKEYIFPEIYIFQTPNATVNGKSNLFRIGNFIAFHDLYKFDEDFTSEELKLTNLIVPDDLKVYTKIFGAVSFEIKEAANFLDALSGNYAHFMTEILPRISLFSRQKNLKNIPFLIDEGLHPNLIRAIKLVAGEERKIIFIKSHEAVFVKKLFTISPAGYIPFNKRGKSLLFSSHGLFSSYALKTLTNTIFDSLKINPSQNEYLPKKIYLYRSQGLRRLNNHKELKEFLESVGFQSIDVASLTFDEQVRLFNNADVLIGPSGAAFANLIFCKKKLKIIVLMVRCNFNIFFYWVSIASIYNKRISYVLGKNETKRFHDHFSVDIEDVKKLLVTHEQ